MQSRAEVKRSTSFRTEMSIASKESKQVSTRMTVIVCFPLFKKKVRNAGESLL